MVTQMEEDVDVDFDEMMLQRAQQSRHRRRGRIPSLRLHTREEDVSTQENTPASQEIESLEYPSMCGQQRIERTPTFESDEGDFVEGGHTGQVGVDGPHDQHVGLQSATTQSHPTPSSHEQVNFFLPPVCNY
jgi:hypothetical protein